MGGFSYSYKELCMILLLYLGKIDCLLRSEGRISSKGISQNTKVDYKTYHFHQKVDHFGFSNQDVFSQRYLVADQYWDGEGPIFFYTGNEGDITWFCNNTGLLWDWAPEFKALLILAEHRYYGESLPYGTDSYKDLAHLGYLTTEQALADFVTLLEDFKKNTPKASSVPVVAFGGSYGGMLAAWLKMKYPHVVVGSLAASAPIWQFGDLVSCGKFYEIVSNDFKKSGPNCAQNIQKSWKIITSMGDSDAGRSFLYDMFHLCMPLKTTADVSLLKNWLSETWVNLAMVDYPYPASFLEPLPAWPIKEVCKFLSNPAFTDKDLIEQLYKAVNLYFNGTGDAQCFNTTQQATVSLGDLGWSFQACTEMVMPLCSDGVHDMFEPIPWNVESFAASCKETWWGVETRPDWAIEQYGGKNIKSASNIIFSNGLLDPWSGAGVTTSLSETLVAILIPEGAHHLDLRSANPGDPQSVIQARLQEKKIIQGWIKDFHRTKSLAVQSLASKNTLKEMASPQDQTETKDKKVPLGAVVMAVVLSLGLVCASVFVVSLALSGRNRTRVYSVKSTKDLASRKKISEYESLLS